MDQEWSVDASDGEWNVASSATSAEEVVGENQKHVNKHIFEQTDKTSTGCEPLRSGAQLHFQIQQQEQCLQPRECRWRRGSRRG